ncbi:MAG: hypothetical protein V4507_00365 [Verrucomicrobiota bacterium]
MKYLGALLLLFLSIETSFSQVVWQFNYTDTAGSGFNDSTLGAARRASLESAAALLGSWIGQSATVQMDISSVNNSTYGYATASSVVSLSNGFNKTVIQNKIQTNGTSDLNGVASDGGMTFNFFYNWSYGDTVGASAYDFKSIALRQLTHALGFVSGISELGRGLNNASSGNADSFLYFDQFLVDGLGNHLVVLSNGSDPFSATFDTSRFSDLTNGIYFKGTQAVAGYGAPVPLYSPDVWEDGQSLSHLNNDSFLPDALMESSVTTGLMSRQWNPAELGIMKDLGYSLTAIPEPSDLCWSLGGFIGLLYFKGKKKFPL